MLMADAQHAISDDNFDDAFDRIALAQGTAGVSSTLLIHTVGNVHCKAM
jgi:hypothetical protein